MSLSTLRNVSLLVVLVLCGLAASDAVCALPCAFDRSDRPAPQTADAGHGCHITAEPDRGPIVAADDTRPCQMQHGDAGPVLERAGTRASLMPLPVDVAAYECALTLATLGHVSRVADAGGGRPPGSPTPLRI